MSIDQLWMGVREAFFYLRVAHPLRIIRSTNGAHIFSCFEDVAPGDSPSTGRVVQHPLATVRVLGELYSTRNLYFSPVVADLRGM